ncbi:hypothetical protein GCM10027059_50190 [Myceligenerans halotolerans]
MSDIPRRPAGSPDSTGGQFTATARTPAPLQLEETAAIPLSALGLTPGGVEHVDGFDFQSPYFEWADIVANDDGGTFQVRAGVSLGVREGLSDLLENRDGPSAEELEDWLAARALPIEAWFADEYGVRELVGDDWDSRDAVVLLDELDPATTTDALSTLLESKTRAVALHDAADPGHPASLWPRLAAHLRDLDEQADQAVWAYTNAALWTDGDVVERRSGGGSWSPDDIDPANRAALTHELRTFLTLHRDQISRAREVAGDYDAAQIGHDLWLTRNGHGTGFWDRGLGSAGDALSDAVRGHESHLSVSDGGLLVIE